eukprot:GEMP01078266.1.p1 GENE.GEMP01078266.1~~GEMP01078266.1.p1  ORF type:complete len:217 (+),score=23.51 GEMP01078266.1:39-689(+)
MLSLASLVFIALGDAMSSVECADNCPYDYFIPLRNDTIKQITVASTGDWFVVFHMQHCKYCKKALPIITEFANKVRGKPKVGGINVQRFPELKEIFNIVTVPTIIFFSYPKRYRYESATRTVAFFEEFVAKSKKQKENDTATTNSKKLPDEFKSLFRTHRTSAIIVLLGSFAFGAILCLCCVIVYIRCLNPSAVERVEEGSNDASPVCAGDSPSIE